MSGIKQMGFKVSAIMLIGYFATILFSYGYYIVVASSKIPLIYTVAITGAFLIFLAIGAIVLFRSIKFLRGERKPLSESIPLPSGSEETPSMSLDDYDDLSEDEIEEIQESLDGPEQKTQNRKVDKQNN